jgi:hypothetical protein
LFDSSHPLKHPSVSPLKFASRLKSAVSLSMSRSSHRAHTKVSADMGGPVYHLPQTARPSRPKNSAPADESMRHSGYRAHTRVDSGSSASIAMVPPDGEIFPVHGHRHSSRRPCTVISGVSKPPMDSARQDRDTFASSVPGYRDLARSTPRPDHGRGIPPFVFVPFRPHHDARCEAFPRMPPVEEFEATPDQETEESAFARQKPPGFMFPLLPIRRLSCVEPLSAPV